MFSFHEDSRRTKTFENWISCILNETQLIQLFYICFDFLSGWKIPSAWRRTKHLLISPEWVRPIHFTGALFQLCDLSSLPKQLLFHILFVYEISTSVLWEYRCPNRNVSFPIIILESVSRLHRRCDIFGSLRKERMEKHGLRSTCTADASSQVENVEYVHAEDHELRDNWIMQSTRHWIMSHRCRLLVICTSRIWTCNDVDHRTLSYAVRHPYFYWLISLFTTPVRHWNWKEAHRTSRHCWTWMEVWCRWTWKLVKLT